jgi:hypothetical protein
MVGPMTVACSASMTSISKFVVPRTASWVCAHAPNSCGEVRASTNLTTAIESYDRRDHSAGCKRTPCKVGSSSLNSSYRRLFHLPSGPQLVAVPRYVKAKNTGPKSNEKFIDPLTPADDGENTFRC